MDDSVSQRPPQEEKYCKKCGGKKSAYWYKGKGIWQYSCLVCTYARKKAKNPRHGIEYHQRRKARDPEYQKRARSRAKARKGSSLVRRSNKEKGVRATPGTWTQCGMTKAQFKAAQADLYEAQGGICAICKRPETTVTEKGVPRSLAVDHDHQTGQIRSLLCRKCNTAMGLAGDSPERLRAMAAYLELHKRERKVS